jgi:hypothetical protein
MLVLLDRGFDAVTFLSAVNCTGAMLLARVRSQRVPPVLQHLPDGSYLSNLGGLAVRIIEADVTMCGADGTRIGDRYRLVTTVLDHHRCPADALIRLYHERWEIESGYLALRHTMLEGHVLRSGDRAGLEQEVWALLTLYQLLRMAMTTAVETRPGTNPDRASFTTALQTARDQLTAAAGICPNPAEPTDRDCCTERSRSNLAAALAALGEYRRAAELYQQTLTARERVLGAEHPDTLRSRNDVALALAGRAGAQDGQRRWWWPRRATRRAVPPAVRR